MSLPRSIFVLRLATQWTNHSELAIARSAGPLGVRVIGVRGGGAAVASSRYSRGRVSLDPGASVGDMVKRLMDIGSELGRPLLIPADDDASVLLSDHASELGPYFLFPTQTPGVARQLSDKGRLHHLCGELGIPTPRAFFPHSRSDVEDYARNGPFPVVVKRMAAWVPSRGERISVEIVKSAAQLLDAYEQMESPADESNLMLQEFIPPAPNSSWMFNGYFSEDSACKLGLTGIKVRQTGNNAGSTTLGACVPNPEVARNARRLMEAVGYRGIIDMGYRFDPRDSRYKLLDVNPRIGGTFRLFVSDDGTDVLQAMLFDLAGEPVPAANRSRPRKWLAENLDALVALRAIRTGELTVRSWLGSLRGIDESAWFARDDPLPFLVMCAEFPMEIARRRLFERRRRADL